LRAFGDETFNFVSCVVAGAGGPSPDDGREQWMDVHHDSFGILQVINLTGLVFQEDAGSRNILGGAEQSVSERRNERGRCRKLTENGYCAI